ncbi:MAG: type III-A CRISPR-associated protein Csm2 [Tannerella sp.]|jgi:CRISPR-associated protein Csm2|nr:type III-A CRISPR-associated protein Csm2 [Tannerella sp.]
MEKYSNNNNQHGNFNANRSNYNHGGGNNRASQPRSIERQQDNYFFDTSKYKEEWIIKGVTKELVDYAKYAGKYMADNKLTNSKIRTIYGEIKRIQMSTFDKEESAFLLLKPKVAYALGRDATNKGLQAFKKIFDLCSEKVTDQKSFQNFCNFMEAILAYHRAFGGKD